MAGTFRIAPDLHPVVADMCRRSPTFRRQVARLAGQSDLAVTVSEIVVPAKASWRALTAIKLVDGRVRSADVHVPAGQAVAIVTLVAHEFEHILEQLDGVDLQRWVGRSGVHRVGADRRAGPFETARAQQIGELVAAEYTAAAPEITAFKVR